MHTEQDEIDQANSQFWNELCGTGAATAIGVTDDSKESLAKFDGWFLSFYPYFLPIVRPERMRGKKVLEIGLGYGTLGQKLAEAGADYAGLDIAAKPVANMNWRLQLHELPGRAVRGSALEMPFPDASFDFIVSIGCFHHTGNVGRCFAEAHRVLKPGGTLLAMVYNKLGFREWQHRPGATLQALWRDLMHGSWVRTLSAKERRAYDANLAGEAAPETVLLSIRDLRRMLSDFAEVKCQKQNADDLYYKNKLLVRRENLLDNVGRWLGLDIYVEARKAEAEDARRAA